MQFVRFELGIVEVNALETDFNVIKKELDVFPSSTDLCTDKDFGIETYARSHPTSACFVGVSNPIPRRVAGFRPEKKPGK